MDLGLPSSDCSATIGAIYNDPSQKRRKRSADDLVTSDAAPFQMASLQTTHVITKSPGSPDTGDTQQHSSTHCEHTSNTSRIETVIDDGGGTVTGLKYPGTNPYPPLTDDISGQDDPHAFKRHGSSKRSRTSFDQCGMLPQAESTDAMFPSGTASYGSTARPGTSTWSEHTAADSAWPQPTKSQHTGSMASETVCMVHDSPRGPERIPTSNLSLMTGTLPAMPGASGLPGVAPVNIRRPRKAAQIAAAAAMPYHSHFPGHLHGLPHHRMTADGGLRTTHSMHTLMDGPLFSSPTHLGGPPLPGPYPHTPHLDMHGGSGIQSLDHSPVVPGPTLPGLQHASSAPLPDIWYHDAVSPEDPSSDGPDEGWLTAREFYDLFSADRRPVRLPQIIIQDITKDLIEDYRQLQALKRVKGEPAPAPPMGPFPAGRPSSFF